ncbi:hypothetical protein [Bdellovibrio bacteriovorus]|uniref:hypothetical protein n=1 Tax=Bdellovibrio bacteriovorus TaxID=959 RepID=UPI0035A5F6B9
MRLLTIAVFSISVVLNACSFKKDDEAPAPEVKPNLIETIEQEQTKQAVEGVLTKENVKVSYEEMPNPGSYKMIVQWPENIRKVSIQVNSRLEVIVNQTSRYEEVVNDDSVSNLKLRSFDQFGSPISTLEIETKSPDDLVLNDLIVMTESKAINVNRAYFQTNGQIRTEGHLLSFKANKIFISEIPKAGEAFTKTAQIVTFIPGRIAKANEELSGSSIAIQAEEAYGTLRVALVGVNGINGRDGTELAKEKIFDLSKLNGANGQAGETREMTRPCTASRMDRPCNDITYICSKAPTNGEDGKPGYDGIDGEAGSNGGNTGNLAVFVNKSDNFTLEIGKYRGLPGKGGKGSPGTLGGRGGKAGAHPGSGCPIAKDGANGRAGNPGVDGADGKPGNDGTITTGPFKVETRDI